MSRSSKLTDVIEATLDTMAKKGLSSNTIDDFKQICNHFRKKCNERGIEDYTEEIGRQYVEKICTQMPPYCKSTIKRHKVIIDRMNCALNGVEWKPRKKPSGKRKQNCYDEILAEYTSYLRKAGKTPRNIYAHNLNVYKFLSFLEQSKCHTLDNMSATLIHEAFMAATNKTKFRYFIGMFVKYLYTREIIKNDLRSALPSTPRRYGVPSVYTPVEVEKILSSINRETEAGKRNYAMTLIAARLGLRVSDIAGLTFRNLYEDKGTIEIVQIKTQQPLTLPFIEEVREAIFDYTNHFRSNIIDGHIFLHIGGYEILSPQGVSNAITKVFKKSGIEHGNRKRGAHSLRSSLATALLSEGNNYATIQKALGHRDIQTVSSYAKADIENLRDCALNVPTASGKFLTAIGGRHEEL